jgi:mannose-6-phosphate isomerase-like protein (cupin superfamily)
MSNCKPALVTAAIAALLLVPRAHSQAQPAASSQTGNAVNGIDSYPSPASIKYPPRETEERRIDLFFGDWRESLPEFRHGSLVTRDILTQGDNFQPPSRARLLQYAGGIYYASLGGYASTTPSTLHGHQEVYYVESGTGTITAGGVTADIHKDVAILVPENLEFTMQNTGDRPLKMYLIDDPAPPSFHPRADLLVLDEEKAHIRTPARVASYASGIGVTVNPADLKSADPYISPGASGHWAHIVRELFSKKEGLATLSNVITVVINPMTMGEPHPHQPGHEEVWLALEGTTLAMAGSELRPLHPGQAYMVRPDAEMTHSNINVGDAPAKFLFFVNQKPEQIKP